MSEVNRIPAEPFVELVTKHLSTLPVPPPGSDFLSPSASLAARAKVPRDTLEKVLAGNFQTVDFNFVDRIVCAMDVVHIWWSDWRDLYYSVPLDDEAEGGVRATIATCAAKGCSNLVPPQRGGPLPKRFCCARCKQTEYDRVSRGSERTLKNKRFDRCPKGHDRSPENVVYQNNGKQLVLRCRVCLNEKQSRRRLRQRQEAQLAA